MQEYGKKVWFIPDCYYPAESTDGPYVSHEAICILNVNSQAAEIKITPFYEDKDPDPSFFAVCDAKRTVHLRMDRLTNPGGMRILKGVPYAVMIESNVPIFVQYSRVDTSQERLGLATTIPCCG